MNFIKKRNLPELLAPAGSFEHLKAAVAAGADAIYMGGEKFGARAYAHNFSREDMIEALQFAHFHERKLYLTVNTLMKEKELFEELGLWNYGGGGYHSSGYWCCSIHSREFP